MLICILIQFDYVFNKQVYFNLVFEWKADKKGDFLAWIWKYFNCKF